MHLHKLIKKARFLFHLPRGECPTVNTLGLVSALQQRKVLTANDHDDVLIMCALKAALTRGELDSVGAAVG